MDLNVIIKLIELKNKKKEKRKKKARDHNLEKL